MFFSKLGMAAGNSSMANTIDPFFMSLPVYMYDATYGVDIAAHDVVTIKPDTTYAYITKNLKTNTGAVSLLTGGVNNTPTIQTICETGIGSFGCLNPYNDETYSNISWSTGAINNIVKAGTATAIENPIGGAGTTLNYFWCTDPQNLSTSNSVKCNVKLTNTSGGADTYYGFDYSYGLGSVCIQKDTDGVVQYTKRIYSGSYAVQLKHLFPLPDGRVILITNRGLILLSSTGTTVWSRGSPNSSMEEQVCYFDDTYTYLYFMDGSQLRRIIVATGGEEYVSASTMFNSIATSGTGYNMTSSAKSRRLCKDVDGNFWILVVDSARSDTIACFDSSWNFIIKYTIAQTGSSYRSWIYGVEPDGNNIILVGNIIRNTTTPYSLTPFITKLARNGSTTGVVTADNSTAYGTAQTITISSSTTQGGSAPSWTVDSPSAFTHSNSTISGYDIKNSIDTSTNYDAFQQTPYSL